MSNIIPFTMYLKNCFFLNNCNYFFPIFFPNKNVHIVAVSYCHRSALSSMVAISGYYLLIDLNIECLMCIKLKFSHLDASTTLLVHSSQVWLMATTLEGLDVEHAHVHSSSIRECCSRCLIIFMK